MATTLGKNQQEDHDGWQFNAKIVKVSSLFKLDAITDPSAPEEGDLWYDGTVLKFFDGTDTQTLAFISDLA